MSSSGPGTLPLPKPGQRPVTRLNLRRSLRCWHTLFSGGMTVLALTMSALALAPLVSVLFMVVIRGIATLRPSVFWELPRPRGCLEGGWVTPWWEPF